MIPIIGLSFLLGAAFSLYFTALILFPAIAVVFVIVVTLGMAEGADFWPIMLLICSASSALQTGYIGGIVMRLLFAGARVGSEAHRSPTSATSARTARRLSGTSNG